MALPPKLKKLSLSFSPRGDLKKFREMEAVRLCLKHFRQRDKSAIFQMIQNECNVQLEDANLTELYQQLVIHGDLDFAETLMLKAAEKGLFNDFIVDCPYRPQWTQIVTSQPETPSCRGGHQMCLDSQCQMIYLLGGWNGNRDLPDFWRFDIRQRLWHLIARDTKA